MVISKNCKLNKSELDLANDKIYISNLKENNVTLKVFDISGKEVINKKVSNKEQIDMSQLSKGIYQLSFEGKEWKEKRKIIKE